MSLVELVFTRSLPATSDIDANTLSAKIRYLSATSQTLSLFQLATRDADLLAVIRCAIRLYMLIDEASRPETHEALRSWMKSLLFALETGLNGTRLVWMRAGIDIWDEVGEDIMWQSMRYRARGGYLPN